VNDVEFLQNTAQEADRDGLPVTAHRLLAIAEEIERLQAIVEKLLPKTWGSAHRLYPELTLKSYLKIRETADAARGES
jgi:hypothetical protein